MLEDGDGNLTDDSGRGILFFEGYVLQGHCEDVQIGTRAFEQVRGRVISAFRDRWLTRDYSVPEASDAIPCSNVNLACRRISWHPYKLPMDAALSVRVADDERASRPSHS